MCRALTADTGHERNSEHPVNGSEQEQASAPFVALPGQKITPNMALSRSRLVAGAGVLVLALAAAALVSSGAAERGTGSGQLRAANAPGSGQRPQAPVRPLGLRTPVAAPPPPRSGTPRASTRPYHPPPPPPPPPPCS
ncbi:hypothetical protein BS78_01G179800 [Paspalum vaginatum]|nr:hypothetical protein BS78_01G179800 [Paspalum vaginatum]